MEKIHLAGLLKDANSVADEMTSHKLGLFQSAVQNDSLWVTSFEMNFIGIAGTSQAETSVS